MSIIGAHRVEALLASSVVIDVSFQAWAEQIDMGVGEDKTGSFPYDTDVWLLSFVRPTWVSLDLSRRPRDAKPIMQWRVDSVSARELGDAIEVSMESHYMTPATRIVCAHVTAEWVSTKELDKHVPGWRTLGRGLALPGLRQVLGY
jgi:hypothetical protein